MLAVPAVLPVTVKCSCNCSYMRMLAQHEYMVLSNLQPDKRDASNEAGLVEGRVCRAVVVGLSLC